MPPGFKPSKQLQEMRAYILKVDPQFPTQRKVLASGAVLIQLIPRKRGEHSSDGVA